MRGRVIKLIKFLAAGLPSFLVAVPLNWLLVTKWGVPKGLAYALVLSFQVTLNFFMCRWFVFEKTSDKSLMAEFGAFVAGIAFFRLADWGVYSLLVSVVGFHYIAVQLLNVVLFSVLKFLYSERVMGGGAGDRGQGSGFRVQDRESGR
jgi:putative flippase GtrA